MGRIGDAATLAEELVAPLGRRWRHVQAVATRAAELAPAVTEVDCESLVAAAWLHDIGYSPTIAHTGFHPLDGAHYLNDHGWPASVANLVAHHPAARYEADERGLTDELARFAFEPSAMQDALDTADLMTGPDGQRLRYNERMDEILHRYPPGDPVHRFLAEIARPIEEQQWNARRAVSNVLSRTRGSGTQVVVQLAPHRGVNVVTIELGRQRGCVLSASSV